MLVVSIYLEFYKISFKIFPLQFRKGQRYHAFFSDQFYYSTIAMRIILIA